MDLLGSCAPATDAGRAQRTSAGTDAGAGQRARRGTPAAQALRDRVGGIAVVWSATRPDGTEGARGVR